MFVVDAIWALILAIALGLILSSAFGVRGPWAAPWAIFVVLFLFIWAGGVWVTPVGPPVFGIYWMPFLLFGLLMALLIASGSEARREPRPRTVGEERAEEEEAAAIGLTAFFWFLIAALILAILVGYL